MGEESDGDSESTSGDCLGGHCSWRGLLKNGDWLRPRCPFFNTFFNRPLFASRYVGSIVDTALVSVPVFQHLYLLTFCPRCTTGSVRGVCPRFSTVPSSPCVFADGKEGTQTRPPVFQPLSVRAAGGKNYGEGEGFQSPVFQHFRQGGQSIRV